MHAEIRGIELRIVFDRGGSAAQTELAAAHHVDAARYAEHALGVLLDQEDGHALLADRAKQLIDPIDHRRRQTERRFVEHNEPRSRQQRPRNGELLLFAAGEQPGGLTPPLCKNRKHGEEAIDVGRHGA